MVPHSAPLRVEWLRVERIDDALLTEWSELTGSAADANVFAEPWLAVAGMRHCACDSAAELLVVRDFSNGLSGIAMLSANKRIGRSPLKCSGDWSHPNAFLLSATAREGTEAACWTSLIQAVETRHGNCRALLIDGLVEGSAMHGGLVEATIRLKLPIAIEARTVRAMLSTDLEADTYWDAAVRAKKRKELRRQWARLGELGALNVDHGDAEGSADTWIEEFLALEASGWKGTNGSALASNADTHAFFSEAMREGWARRQVLLTALRLDGRAIAMLITLVSYAKSGGAGFSFKTAFDEEFARFSPGVLLQRESLGLLTSRKLAFIDSCAAQDHPMIDSLWRERRAVVTLSLPLPGTANRLAWQATQGAMRVWKRVKMTNSNTFPSRLREGSGVGPSESDPMETDPPVPGNTPHPTSPPESGRGDISCFGPEARTTIAAVYPNYPATFDHGLRAHPLLTLDALAALGQALPAASVEYNLADIDVSTLPDDAPTNGLGIGDTIRTIAANKSWAVLKNVEQIPVYRDLIATLLAELDDTVAMRTGPMLTLQGYVFVSSPGSMTPYHFDPEHNILLQLQGNKTMHVWPSGDRRFAEQIEHERYHSGGHRGLPWNDAWEANAFVADLVPGRAVLVPVMAPHYVRNGPEPSISLSITWRSQWSYRESEAHAANRWLRARGFAPAMPPRWPKHARGKTLAWRAARRLGLVG